MVIITIPASADESKYIRHGVVLPVESAEESLEFVPVTGNYILTYKTQTVDGEDMLFQIEFVPATKKKTRVRDTTVPQLTK